MIASVLPLSLMAGPSGGTTASGAVNISQKHQETIIHQGSEKAIIHWDDFSIGKGELVQFLMPHHSSAVLNRVITQNPSALYGTLKANGKVYLLNPNGILIGPEGLIDTAGFLASTLNLEDRLFLEGGDLQFSDGGAGSILNLGTIRSSQGDVILFSRSVRNEGIVDAPNGAFIAGAGDEVFLHVLGDEKIWIKGTGKIENAGTVQAACVEIKANADNPYSLAIQSEGLVSATGVVAEGGRIYLRADQGQILVEGSLIAESGLVDVTGDAVVLDKSGRVSVDGGQKGNGGTALLIGQHSVRIEGAVSAKGGDAGGDGGFIEFSAPQVEFLHPVDATAPCGKAGRLLLDPYDVQLSYSDPGGLITSWVDVNAASPVISTLDAGTNVTISTAVNTNYDATRSNAEPGDIFVVDPVSVAGNGTLDLVADRNIEVSALMSNIGTGSFNFTAGGDISFISPGALNIGGSGIAVSCSATGSVLLNDAQNPASTSTIITNNGDVTITATNGDIRIFGSPMALAGNTGTGTVHLETQGSGDIVFVAGLTCGIFEVLTGAGGDVFIGNDSTGTLSLGFGPYLSDPSTTGFATSFEGDNVTFQSGGGNEALNLIKGSFSATARTGDILISCPGTGMGSVDIRSQATGPFAYTLSAPSGSISLLAGANTLTPVLLGSSGLGSSTGTLDITAGLDLIFQAGSASSCFVDVRADAGDWTIGRDFLATAGSGDNSPIICYIGDVAMTQSSLDVGRNATFSAGSGDASLLHAIWANVDFSIGSSSPPAPDGNLQLLGGSGSGVLGSAWANLVMAQSGSTAQTVFRDVLVQGGTNTDCYATFQLSSSGNADLLIGNDLTVQGGTGESAEGEFFFDSDLIDVGNNLLVQGVVGNASLGINASSGAQTSLYVRGASAQILGGAGGVDPDSLGEAVLNGSSNGPFDMEVLGNLIIMGGSGANASALLQSSVQGAPGFQQIYVQGDIDVSAGLSSDGISGIVFPSAAASPITQRVEAGGNITVTAGSGNSIASIQGVTLVDPTGIIFPPGVDSPGPSIFVRALGNITGVNGAGTYPAGIENIEVPIIAALGVPFPPPAGVAYAPGDIVVQAGGNVQLGSGMQTGTTIGSFNLNNSIYIEANTQFAPGALWPGSAIMPASGVSPYPLGQGALIANTGAFPSVDFMTINGNISLISAQNDITPALANFTGGTAANTVHIATASGNILINGFNDIQIFDPLTTAGNATLVSPATDQIFIRANHSIDTSHPITLTGSGFSIGLYANLNPAPVGNIDVGESITAHFTTGTINIDSPLGYIHQTLGTITANTLNFNAAAGIINPSLADQAVRTSAHFVNATNADQLLYIYNTVAGANTTSTTATLDNGTGAASTGRDLYFAQHGGTSLIVAQATADGNASLLAYDGQANLTFNGLSRAAENLIGMAYRNMTVTGAGTVRAAQNVTLILDEYTGPAYGGSLFTNGGSILSDLPTPNIAIYAASGLEPPSGYVVANLMIPGNLSGIETWDSGTPAGLMSKYETSWQAGGLYHGPGFGAVYIPGTGVFSSPVVWYKTIPQLTGVPGGPVLSSSQILGFESQIFQTYSLLNDFSKWGRETCFSIAWKADSSKKGWQQGLHSKYYLLIDDPYRQHRVKEIYEQMTRRKYIYDR